MKLIGVEIGNLSLDLAQERDLITGPRGCLLRSRRLDSGGANHIAAAVKEEVTPSTSMVEIQHQSWSVLSPRLPAML